MTIYEINEAYLSILARAEEYAEEHAGEILPDMAAALELVSGERMDKIENLLKYYKNESANAEMVAAEFASLQKRMKQHEANAQRVKEVLAAIVGEKNKIELGCGKIGWRVSRGVEIINAQLLPESCFVTKREMSKTNVKDEIENGNIPESVARIYERQNISIE